MNGVNTYGDVYKAFIRRNPDTEKTNLLGSGRLMITNENYRSETIRLRENIEKLRKYCEQKAEMYYNDGDAVMDVYDRGMASAYSDIARKLNVVAFCEVCDFELVSDK